MKRYLRRKLAQRMLAWAWRLDSRTVPGSLYLRSTLVGTHTVKVDEPGTYQLSGQMVRAEGGKMVMTQATQVVSVGRPHVTKITL